MSFNDDDDDDDGGDDDDDYDYDYDKLKNYPLIEGSKLKSKNFFKYLKS
jgi:hypothetical protein